MAMLADTISLSPEEVEVRNKQLELGWNNKISIDKESRRSLTMSADIRDFIHHSTTPGANTNTYANTGGGGSPGNGKFGGTSYGGNGQTMGDSPTTKPSGGGDAFETIANTFGFIHHAGTDHSLELKIIKYIVSRESQLMKLMHLCQQKEAKNPDGEIVVKPLAGNKILQLMISLRDTTLSYLDTVQEWRDSASNTENEMNDGGPKAEEGPKVFVWEGYNYTMKIISDMDFLGDSESLAEALGIPIDKLLKNPLMLSSTLEETADAWMDPGLRASYDCNNQTSGTWYEERLRLRNSERMLLTEIECNTVLSMDDILAGRDFGQDPISSMNNQGKPSNSYDPAMLTWQQDARDQANDLNPKEQNYNAVKNMKNRTGGRQLSPNENKAPGNSKQGQQQQRQGQWNAQADTFIDNQQQQQQQQPTQQQLDSNVAFYEDFQRVDEGEQMIPLSEMNQYDSYLSGNNVLDLGPDLASNDNGGYADQFGFVDNNNMNNQGLDGQYQFGFSRGEDDMSSSNISAGTSLVFENVSEKDIELICSIQDPPNSVELAGAACCILLHQEAPEDPSWKEFCNLADTEDVAEKMNSIDPLKIPEFKIRSIKPFVTQITFGTSNGVVDLSASQVNNIGDSEGMNLNLDDAVIVSTERVFRWVRQVIFASSNNKKKSKKQNGNEPVMLTSDTVQDMRHDSLFQDSKMLLMGGKPLKDEQGRSTTKAGQQRQRAEMMMKGMTVGKKKSDQLNKTRKTEQDDDKKIKPTELWPVHTEILENTYKHPLLLTVLSTQQETDVNSIAAKKIKKEMLQYDPLEVAGNGGAPPPDRIVVKIYNLVDSQETAINVNIREFTLFLYDLIDRYSSDAANFFRPASLLWWMENLRSIISVTAKVNKKLMLVISKSAIEKIVKKGLGLEGFGDEWPSLDGVDSSVMQGLGSMPNSIEVGALSSSQEDNMQGASGAEDWGFYGEEDFDNEANMEKVNVNGKGGGSKKKGGNSRQEYSREKKPSRQELRNQFDANTDDSADPEVPEVDDSKKSSSNGRRGQQQTPGIVNDDANASKKKPHSDKPKASRGGVEGRNNVVSPEDLNAMDYGEDVFEDDGQDGGFEEEVEWAEQMSRSISREKPLSAPGSLSAPVSMSSVPSRHGGENLEYLSDEPIPSAKGSSHGGSIASEELVNKDTSYDEDFTSAPVTNNNSIEEIN